MTQQFFIDGVLPGMNEILAASGSVYRNGTVRRRNGYSELKKKWQHKIVTLALEAQLQRMERVYVICHWREMHDRRDVDNICAGVKFILDALKAARVIPDDSQKHIAGIEHHITSDRAPAGVLVELRAVEDQLSMI